MLSLEPDLGCLSVRAASRMPEVIGTRGDGVLECLCIGRCAPDNPLAFLYGLWPFISGSVMRGNILPRPAKVPEPRIESKELK